MRKRRVMKANTPRPKPPKGYDSHFEYELHQKELSGCKLHSEKITYTQEKEYNPDFVIKNGKYKILIEAKGRFRDAAEARKYVDIAAGLPKTTELVFLFQAPSKPMPNAQTRKKCGTKRTHAEWAEGQGFRWFSRTTCLPEWRK